MQFEGQQATAINLCGAWLKLKQRPFFYLAGYAGTGKTTIALRLAELSRGSVAFAAYTGKAARVMRDKGCAGASTIHSLIYNSQVDPETGNIRTTLDPEALDYVDLVIIDECSMVDETVGKDLLSFKKPVLVLGDPAQLPPVEGAGFFTSKRPDFMLTEIHRQAADSPIIRLATDIREGRRYEEISTRGLWVTKRANIESQHVLVADTVLVGKNDTRVKYNRRIRELRGFTGPTPQDGEKVICLNNDRLRGVYNGELFRVTGTLPARRKGCVKLSIFDEMDGIQKSNVVVRKEFFGSDLEAVKNIPWRELTGTQQFTFGNAITVHKSQGSQWDDVVVFDESRVFGKDRNRWLYTAVTRAAKHLTLVMP